MADNPTQDRPAIADGTAFLAPLLSNEDLQTWWSLAPDASRIVTYEEALENWPIDDSPEVKHIIKEIGEIIDRHHLNNRPDEGPARYQKIADFMVSNENLADLRLFLASMSARRRMRFIIWIDQHVSDRTRSIVAELITEDVAPYSSDTERIAAKAIQNSLMMIRRAKLLSQLFRPSRLKMISDALALGDDEAK